MIGGDAIRIVAPSAMPVTLAELKADTRYFESDEDAVLAKDLRAAVELVEQYTGLGLISQTWTQAFPAFPATTAGALLLRRRPLQSVLFVNYLDTAGADQTLGDTVYRVSGIGQAMHPAALTLNTGGAWPSLYAAPGAITVTYRVGFGDTHNDVPELIRDAILLTASTRFAFREEVVVGSTVAELPYSAKVILRDYRPLAVA